jgi:REP element-mobilizing transposase RayT
MSLKPGQIALRKGRHSIRNHYYLVTASTHLRRPVFENPEYAAVVLDALKWLDGNQALVLDTAIVMPDHVHCGIQLQELTLPKILQRFKGYTARTINQMMGQTGPLWQPGYHDHAIRKDEDLGEIRRYCLGNPVRANLVERYDQYPHWYCGFNHHP